MCGVLLAQHNFLLKINLNICFIIHFNLFWYGQICMNKYLSTFLDAPCFLLMMLLTWCILAPVGCLNIKMPSYQFRDSHVKDKTVSPTVLSLTWESLYLGKVVFILKPGPIAVQQYVAVRQYGLIVYLHPHPHYSHAYSSAGWWAWGSGTPITTFTADITSPIMWR